MNKYRALQFLILLAIISSNRICFADAFNFLDEPWISLVPSSTNTWSDLILTGTIPPGSTGVVLKVRNTNASDRNYGARMNGSTDNRTATIFRQSHYYAFVGVDSTLDFELYHQNNSDLTTWVVGYTGDGVTWLTNAGTYPLTSTNTWTDIDITNSTTGDAIGSIWEIVVNSNWGLRKNGSIDDRVTGGLGGNAHDWIIVGVDSSEICEGIGGGTNTIFYLQGYITKGVTFLTNATNYQTSTTGSYQDLDITADSNGQATGALIEVVATENPFGDYALRTNGSTEDVYDNTGHRNFGLIKVDSDEILEQKISTTNIDTFLLGWTKKSRVMLMDQ